MGRVDTIVVYKIDRLTRSLTDFAKIVEILDFRRAVDDDELAVLRLVAERRHPAHPHPLLLRGGDLVADALADDLVLEPR